MRDRDIRNAIRTLLGATGEFDALQVGRDPSAWSVGSVAAHSVQIDPASEAFEALWDGGGLDGGVVSGRAVLTFTCQDEDPQVRDEGLERLYNLACDALNHIALPIANDTSTMPAFTYIDTFQWQAPVHPSRQGKAAFLYRYFAFSSQGLDTTE